jgi:hypothetical protein
LVTRLVRPVLKPGDMTDDLPSLDLTVLATVNGGASSSDKSLTLAMNQIKSSLSTLKQEASGGSAGDPMQMMMMMMMMGGGGGGAAPAAAAPPPEPAAAPQVTQVTCNCGG